MLAAREIDRRLQASPAGKPSNTADCVTDLRRRGCKSRLKPQSLVDEGPQHSARIGNRLSPAMCQEPLKVVGLEVISQSIRLCNKVPARPECAVQCRCQRSLVEVVQGASREDQR